MNLELPFMDAEPSAVDDFVAAVEEELDALFLEEVDDALRRIRVARDAKPDIVAA